MTSRLVFRPQAESEIIEARNWYEERHVGIGEAFTAAVELTIAGILEHPLAYPRLHGETHRAIMQRFPYAIYFRVFPEEVIVLVVTHGRRHAIGERDAKAQGTSRSASLARGRRAACALYARGE